MHEAHPDDRQRANDTGYSILPYLYAGVGGTAWFLVELYRIVGDERVRATAEGAMRRALDIEFRRRPRHGFYTGTAGLGNVCVRMYEAGVGDVWLDKARMVVERLCEPLEGEGAEDLIAGEAGTILGALRLYDRLGDERLVVLANRCGRSLLKRAAWETEGLSWRTLGATVARNLVGLSHGTSGIALALAELYNRTKESSYLRGVAGALQYEDDLCDRASGEWLDYRDLNLARYIERNRLAELRRDLAADAVPPAVPGRMAAWCHGYPGIALARLRLFELSGLLEFRAEATKLASMLSRECNAAMETSEVSLCHGKAGNADILLELARLGCGDQWASVQNVARSLASKSDEGIVPFSNAVQDSHVDPSLMLGDAGVGLFFLRLADVDVAPALLPRGMNDLCVSTHDWSEGLRDGRRQLNWSRFAHTQSVLESMGVDLTGIACESVGVLRQELEAVVASLPVQRQEVLKGVLATEDVGRELVALREGPSVRLRRQLLSVAPDSITSDTVIRLNPSCSRIVTVSPGVARMFDESTSGGGTFIVVDDGSTTTIRPATTGAERVFRIMERPVTVKDVVAGLAAASGDSGAAANRILKAVKAGLRTGRLQRCDDVPLTAKDIDGALCQTCGECCHLKLYVRGGEDYLEFVREMLLTPLKYCYPQVSFYLVGQASETHVVIDLGSCRHLRRDNRPTGEAVVRCEIYNQRPRVCREFNCVTWWKVQRATTADSSVSQRLIERVAARKAEQLRTSSE